MYNVQCVCVQCLFNWPKPKMSDTVHKRMIFKDKYCMSDYILRKIITVYVCSCCVLF